MIWFLTNPTFKMSLDNIWSLLHEAYGADKNLGAVVRAVLRANFMKQVVIYPKYKNYDTPRVTFIYVFPLPKSSQYVSNFVKCSNIFVILLIVFHSWGNSLFKLYKYGLFKCKDHYEKFLYISIHSLKKIIVYYWCEIDNWTKNLALN